MVKAIVIILIVLMLIYGGYRACQAAKTAIGAPQVASVALAGPATPIPGGTSGTFTATVNMTKTSTVASTVNVSVWEDDLFGDTLLIQTVAVTVPPNALSGTATFTLDCTVNAEEIVGASGRDRENPSEIYIKEATQGVTSSNVTATCQAR
jgi:hypothetical protein